MTNYIKGPKLTTYEEFMANDYTHLKGELHDDFGDPIKVMLLEKEIFTDKDHFNGYIKKFKNDGYEFFCLTEVDKSIISKEDDSFLRDLLSDYVDGYALDRIIISIRDRFNLKGGK